MINTVELLWVGFLLCKKYHLLYFFAYEVGDIHHSHPGKVHQKYNMISIQSGEPTLTSKILDDDLHQ